MFLLGILSIVQVAALPGLIAVRVLRLDGGFLRTFAFSFAFSLLINHLLVLGLVAFGWFTQGAMLGIMGAEVLVLAAQLRLGTGPPAVGDAARLSAYLRHVRSLPLPVALLTHAAGLAAAGAAGVYVVWAVRNCGTVFTEWDAVVSWNPWAVLWFENTIPRQTWNYPQLLPTSFAVTYAFIGEPVQFFAKGLMGLFPLALFAAMADLGLRLRMPAYFLAIAATAYALPASLNAWVMDGYADVPVAVFGFLCISALVAAAHEPEWARAQSLLWAGALCAAACMLTKQAGLIIAATYPVLAFALVAGPRLRMRRAEQRFGAVVWPTALMLLLLSPWYLYRTLVPGGSEIGYILHDIHAGRTYFQRFQHGLGYLTWQYPAFVVLGVLPALLAGSLLHRVWWWILLLVIVPFLVAWFLFFSYSTRNIALAIPLTATAASVGLGCLLNRVSPPPHPAPPHPAAFGPARRFVKAWMLIAPLAALATAGQIIFSPDEMRRDQTALQRRVGAPVANELLYEYADAHGFDGPVATNYQPMKALPDLAPLFRHVEFGEPGLDERLAVHQPRYVFFRGDWPEHLASRVRDGSWEELVVRPSLHLLRIRTPPKP